MDKKINEIKCGGVPKRYMAARVKSGKYPIEDFTSTIYKESLSQMLSDNGLVAEMTKEKMDGTYKRPEHLNDPAIRRELHSNYVVEYLKRYYDLYP
jgi:hypothetical protein